MEKLNLVEKCHLTLKKFYKTIMIKKNQVVSDAYMSDVNANEKDENVV